MVASAACACSLVGEGAAADPADDVVERLHGRLRRRGGEQAGQLDQQQAW